MILHGYDLDRLSRLCESFQQPQRKNSGKLGLSKRIVLMDGEQLARLTIRFDVGCRVEEVFQIKKVDEEFFE